jgi:hypothetical protein
MEAGCSIREPQGAGSPGEQDATQPSPRPVNGRVRRSAAGSVDGGRTTETRTLESIVTKEIGTTEVRQGRTPHIVRYVLAISLTAAVVALAVVWVVMMN